jgi:hypothetical protein
MSKQHERWLPIIGYEGHYEISDMGRVRSVDRIDPRKHSRQGGMMKISALKSGYLRVTLTKNGIEKTAKVHLLVLEAFKGQRTHGMEGRHVNGKKADCSLNNLEWGTHAENLADIAKHGTRYRGEKCRSAKLTEHSVLAIAAALDLGSSQKELAAKYQVSPQTISAIRLRKKWKHLWWSHREERAA